MKLGTLAYITLYSQRPEESKKFCTSLGFKTISLKESSVLLTDGNLYFDLRRSENSATALSYIVDDMTSKIEMAENLELRIVEQSNHHAVIREPNGLNILLIDAEAMPLKEFSRNPISLCGKLYEISLEADDIEKSIPWWQNVGFKVMAQKETWCTMDDGKIMIGLYQRGTCPHKFKNPSVTYFEPDMARRIAEIRKNGIKFLQDEKEIGIEGHAIAESPDGHYFFLFKA